MTPHAPRKRFGQHFLVDQSVIAKIIDAIAPRPDDVVLEIGPGLAALTGPLLDRLPRLHVVEIDRDIVARLRERWPDERLLIHQGDALEFDPGTLGARVRVVGNLPYNVSTPLLFHIAAHAGVIVDGHFMLQKEVVDRMVSPPGGAEYGRLSVMLQYRFRMQRLFDVAAGSFNPPPKVRSAVVRMIPLEPGAFARAQDEPLMARLVAQAFSRRRKTLRNALEGFLDEAGIREADLDPGVRPETVGVDGYVRAADAALRRLSGAG
jgi:16S rRNA (adenine1518-N6/adenine1519-N6)-dimethyltransferase